ncbi:MAG: GTPase Era [Lachnospiraceae bacterium]|nr:GTPase Era [Lachnospiraceae bacterium]
MADELIRSGFVTLTGRPNVGKSTLLNCIVGQKIAITSSKPQTTRNRVTGIYNSDKGQIVFVDTPGIHKARTKLGEYMTLAAEGAVADVDLVLWLVEPREKIGEGEKHIAELLKKRNVPVILVINKIDTVKKADLLNVISAYNELYDFEEIVPCSALKGDNTGDLIETIFKYLPYGPRYYDEESVTDQPERQIIAELIREKSLRCLSDEIPHGIAVSILSMKKRSGRDLYDIEAALVCERDSHKRIIIGKDGEMLKKIGSQARPEIEEMLGCRVNLKIWVKVRKDWRDSDIMVKNFGYSKKEL